VKYTRSAALPDAALPELSPEEVRRYSRHLLLPNVTTSGQRRLKAARVLVVGAGGLGSPVALYLAAAGVGQLGLVDFDAVDITNLQRQLLHGTSDIGRPKVDSARDRLHDVNPNVDIELYPARLSSQNALEIMGDYDLVVDGTDNFATRYLTNDACVILGIPNVYGSVYRFEGQASVFSTENGPCYRCLFREPPPPGLVPSCAEGGVLGVLPGMIGTIQANEAIKLLMGIGEPLVGKLLLVDALTGAFRTVSIRKDPECPACGTREIRQLIDYDAFCGTPAPSETESASGEISPRELAERMKRGDPPRIIDVREPHEFAIARIAGAELIPLSMLDHAQSKLDPNAEIVVLCHSGVRSLWAARHLRDAGFRRVLNLTGGIDRWSDDVDPKVPKY
jgi:molybdopterin/thiamine biosynthesis adenylyltransferase/rhodanese-related sulfurtransferase